MELERSKINHIILALVVITLIVSAYSATIQSTISPEIYIPEDVARRDDIDELATKEDLSRLLAMNDISDITTKKDIDQIYGRLEGIATLVEKLPGRPKYHSDPRTHIGYGLNISFPYKIRGLGTLKVRRGESATLPVAIKSYVEEKRIRLRLVLEYPEPFKSSPELITYETEGYLNINYHETVNTQMILHVSEDATPGEYRYFILCGNHFIKPLGYSGMCVGFRVEILS